jgi:class 3 adenylate cyclase/tetratricopeptide (TPR) repeat protein
MVCPSCSAPLAVGAKFCSSCGHAVTSREVEERRIVTVLFGDVVGFTSLAEHLDPEQVKRLVDGVFERLVEDISSFGGRVDKLLGDGILALFGAPVAHEDDAERAVRAALRMQESLAASAQQAGLDEPLRMRIGINTGEVLVGTLAGTDYTAMGDVVNTASRLQAAAPPGGVLVGAGTHALTADVIEYGEPTDLQPRGREQSVATWLAVGALAPPGVRQRRTDLRLVGREAELSLLRAGVFVAFDQRRPVVVNVVGESGVGKTRLVDELVGELDDDGDRVLLLEGACAPYGESNVWAPIASAMAGHFDLAPHTTPEEVRAQAQSKALALMSGDGSEIGEIEAARAVEVLMHLLGYESSLDTLDVTMRRDLVQRAITRVIELRCERGPLVLWIDDVHWADEVVIALLHHLTVSIARCPFVLLTSMRPGADNDWPAATDQITTVTVTLQPLTRAETDVLALELLGEVEVGGAPDLRLLGALFDRSGGNPLFLQQLAEVVAEDGPASELPDSLRALIAARLDQLLPEERRVLDNAATFGLSGPIVALERFANAMGQPFDRAVVAQLDAKGLLEVEGTRWKFRSDSVRETTYQMITKSARAQRHAGVAASLAVANPGQLDDLAHHTAAAAELVAEIGDVALVPATITTDAIRYLTAAAQRASDSGSHRLAVHHTTRALALLEAQGAPLSDRVPLLLLRAAGAIEQRRFADAHADIDVVLADAIARKDTVTEAEARRRLGALLHLTGDRDNARLELGRSVELLRVADRPALLAEALRYRGFIELFGGSAADAEWFFGEAEAQYVELSDERGLAYIDQHRAWLSFLSGDLELADQRLHRAADTLNRLGDRTGVGWAFGLLAFVRFYQRRFGEAEDLAGVVQGEAIQRGDDWAAAMMQTLMADLRLWQGRLPEALANAEQARNRFRRVGDLFGLGQSLAALVRSQVALGQTTAWQRTVEELLAIGDRSPAGPVPLLAVAGAAMHRGDGRTASAVVRQAIETMEQRTTGTFEADVIDAIASVQLGNLDDAIMSLDRIPATAREHPFAAVAAALVAVLAGDDEEAIAQAEQVRNTDGATYLDRAMAAVAASAAHASLGERDAARTCLEGALDECLRIGDVVATALLQTTHVHVLGHAHESGAGDRGVLGDGWILLVDSLPAVDVSA